MLGSVLQNLATAIGKARLPVANEW